MKKFFTIVLAALAAVSLYADSAVFDFTNPSSLNPSIKPADTLGLQIGGTTYTAGDVTLAFAKDNGNGVKLWTNTNKTYDLRIYQNNSMTISAKEAITQIEFSFTDKGGLVAESGTIASDGTWKGSATSIVFSNPDKGKACKIKSITVYMGAVPVVTVDTVDVKDAVAQIEAAAGKKMTKKMCVKGVVGGLDASGAEQYGNINVWLGDIDGVSTDTIEAFRMTSYEGAKYTSEADLQFGLGDTIVFYASDWSWFADGAQYEGANGSLVKVIGEGHPAPVSKIVFLSSDFKGQTAKKVGDVVTATKGGVTVTAEDTATGDLSLKVFKNAKFSISSETRIERIDFTFYQTYTGDLSASNCVGANSWSVDCMTSQARLDKIEVYLGDGDCSYEIMSAGEALILAQTLKPEAGKTKSTKDTYEVRGYVRSVATDSTGAVRSFYLSDDPEERSDFQVYKPVSINEGHAPLKNGCYVGVVGTISHYRSQDDSKHTYEIAYGKVEVLYGVGLENTKVSVKAKKFFDGNQVVFEANGLKYNVLGNIVK